MRRPQQPSPKARATVGRADLVRAVVTAATTSLEEVALLLGYDYSPRPVTGHAARQPAGANPIHRTSPCAAPGAPSSAPPLASGDRPELPPFFLPTRLTPLPRTEPPTPGTTWLETTAPLDEAGLRAKDQPLPAAPPLQRWSRLWPYLKDVLGAHRDSLRLDVSALVQSSAGLQPLRRLPRVRVRTWAEDAAVVVDRRPELLPFHDDVTDLLRRLARLRGPAELRVLNVDGEVPARLGSTDRTLPAGSPVLVLGDLGQLNQDAPQMTVWVRAARAWQARGHRCSALLPCPRSRWMPEPSRAWASAVWDRDQRLPRRGNGLRPAPDARAVEKREAATRRLLAAISPALRVEPSLLRTLRLFPGHPPLDVGTEFDVWNHPSDVVRTPLAIALRPAVAEGYRQLLRGFGTELSQAVLRGIEAFHCGHGPLLLARERRFLLEAGAVLPEETIRHDRSVLRAGVAAMFRLAKSGDREQATQLGVFEWQKRDIARVSSAERGSDAGMAESWAIAQRWSGSQAQPVPAGVDPKEVAWVHDLFDDDPGVDSAWEVRQQGGDLLLQRAGSTILGRRLPRWEAGSPLAWVTARRLQFEIQRRLPAGELAAFGVLLKPGSDGCRLPGAGAPVRLRTDLEDLEFEPATWPAWAASMARDSSGLRADLDLGGATMTMRWIPPGRFLMGSPLDELGRSSDEGPQHEVRITRGFWLAATPCTQAQWQAVMTSNPSHWKGDMLPVGNLDWNDAQAYATQLTQRYRSMEVLPTGWEFRLPTEAEWEYACRAGTTSAFNDGSACTKPHGKDPALDRLGWFDQNSGGKMHAVGAKIGNNWSLFDMHGNVREWCFDGLRRYSNSPEFDPVGPTGGSGRVVRGGSCWVNAWGCRSAYRGAGDPGFRDWDRGFRLLLGQPVGSGATEREAGPRDEAQADRSSRGAELS